jgi:GTPase SAR1 family protein
MNNISELRNPYDFANPVTEESLFAGRLDELREINYYLNEGIKSKKPINLSLVGDRASGKTSLLNMIEISAYRNNYLTVRIDLDEGDINSQLHFFFKVFDSLVTSVFDSDFFGGYRGKIFEEYLNQVSTFQICNDISFKPFLFPLQFAKAMEMGKENIIISESNFKRDLTTISKTVSRPIILLFDECNVLSASRILLEKLRNIFMNKSGYMLVFTGTRELFPVIDEIFSPIVRQFKKINVTNYKEETDTQFCIDKPLEDIGIEPSDVFEFRSYSELHEITDGKPYEIQLICHNMFKKMQSGEEDGMRLNHKVLEDVRIELETSQNFADRPKLSIIKSFTKESLEHLNFTCKSLGNASLEELFALEYVIHNNKRLNVDRLRSDIDEFLADGILKLNEDGTIGFFGDEFDKIYVKYFALENGVEFDFNTDVLAVNFYYELLNYLEAESFLYSFFSEERGILDRAVNCLLSKENNGEPDDIFIKSDDNRRSLVEAYGVLFKFRSRTVSIVDVAYKIGSYSLFLKIFEDSKSKRLSTLMKAISKRLVSNDLLGKQIEFKSVKTQIPDISTLRERVTLFKDNNLSLFMLNHHYHRYTIEHFQRNFESALMRCVEVLEFEKQISKFPEHLNINYQNLGYIFLCNDCLDDATSCFETASEKTLEDDSMNQALVSYNKAVLMIKKGENNQEALTVLLKSSIEHAASLNGGDQCLCILSGEQDDQGIVFSEDTDSPSLLEVAKKLLTLIESGK